MVEILAFSVHNVQELHGLPFVGHLITQQELQEPLDVLQCVTKFKLRGDQDFSHSLGGLHIHLLVGILLLNGFYSSSYRSQIGQR